MALIYSTPEQHMNTLDRAIPDSGDYDLARRHAPRIRFDALEPFLPSVISYTVFRETGNSASFPRTITLPERAAVAIEYAIWWDWDIQHLYELEHIWIYLDADENVIAAEASSHGGYHAMLDQSGQVPLENKHVILFSEPGKHAFAPMREWLIARKPNTDTNCGRLSGMGGVWVTPLFEEISRDATPLNHNVVRAYGQQYAFVPSYEFSQVFDLAQAVFVPWPTLNDWIPQRVTWWTEYLRETIPPHQRRPLRIAHRGASAYAQEGSTASVEKAVELGADMVEIDIRTTLDQIPVIAHDESLKRIFGVDGTIAEMTLDEIRAVTPSQYQPILTFEDMLTLCGSLGIGLYLDIKEVTPSAMVQIMTLLETHGMMRQAIFGSFRPDVVAEIKANTPSAITSILFASSHIDPVALAQSVKADYVHPCWERFPSPSALLTEEWITRVRGANLGIVCWHEERPQEIAALNALGVDGICSDQPELLVQNR